MECRADFDSERTAILIGSWRAMAEPETALLVDGICIERCEAELGALQRKVRALDPTWLLVGRGLDDGIAAALVRGARAVQPALHVCLLGAPGDVTFYHRWARRGCSLYLVESAGADCVAFALSAVIDHEIVIVDRTFRPQPPEGSLQEPPRITTRERDVLQLVVHGLRTKEIASRLHVSENTVESHLRSLFSKLQVSTRAEAVHKAIRSGAV